LKFEQIEFSLINVYVGLGSLYKNFQIKTIKLILDLNILKGKTHHFAQNQGWSNGWVFLKTHPPTGFLGGF
jgi:hypothetical protein